MGLGSLMRLADNPSVDYDLFLTRLGSTVKRRRLDKGLTQVELAGKVDVEQPTVHRIEKGRQGFDSATIFGIAGALGCSLADLFSEVEQVTPAKLPPEAARFAQTWMVLPHDVREEYRQRIENLAKAFSHTVADERQPARRAGKKTRTR